MQYDHHFWILVAVTHPLCLDFACMLGTPTQLPLISKTQHLETVFKKVLLLLSFSCDRLGSRVRTCLPSFLTRCQIFLHMANQIAGNTQGLSLVCPFEDEIFQLWDSSKVEAFGSNYILVRSVKDSYLLKITCLLLSK